MTPLHLLPPTLLVLGAECSRVDGARQWYGRVGGDDSHGVHVCEDVSAWTVARRVDADEIAAGHGGTLEAAELACRRDLAAKQARYAVAA